MFTTYSTLSSSSDGTNHQETWGGSTWECLAVPTHIKGGPHTNTWCTVLHDTPLTKVLLDYILCTVVHTHHAIWQLLHACVWGYPPPIPLPALPSSSCQEPLRQCLWSLRWQNTSTFTFLTWLAYTHPSSQGKDKTRCIGFLQCYQLRASHYHVECIVHHIQQCSCHSHIHTYWHTRVLGLRVLLYQHFVPYTINQGCG